MTTRSLVRELLDEWKRASVKVAAPCDEELLAEFPLVMSEDIEILMHREVHFGGSFEVMLDYYDHDGKGALLDSRQIRKLAAYEEQTGHDLLSMCLSPNDAKKVQRAQATYTKLHTLYDRAAPGSKERLVADLILAEEEDEEEAIQAVVHEGQSLLPELERLLAAEEFADPLFPGYGYAPQLAAQCLGEIGDPASLPSLFEAVGHPDGEIDEAAIAALGHIGQPARDFLLPLLRAKPVSKDTMRAAAALAAFPPDEQIGMACLTALEDPGNWSNETFTSYLVLGCSGLEKQEDRERLALVIDQVDFPEGAAEEARHFLHS